MLKPKKKLTRREIKEDKLVTTWFKTTDFLEKHPKEIMIAVGGAIAVIVIAVFYRHHTLNEEREASVLFATGKNAYVANNFDVASDSLVKLVNKYGGTASAGVGTIYLANTFMHKQEYEVAERYYQSYLDDYDDDSVLSVAAAAGVAATYDERGDFAKAGELYEKAARKYDDSYRAPELLMNAARCYRFAKQVENSQRLVALLLEKYPESKFAEDAKLLQKEMQS